MRAALIVAATTSISQSADFPNPPTDPHQRLERTCFQTGARWDGKIQLGSDVAICYGIDPGLPARISEWKSQGYVVHLMTGVSWGQYQDYLYGRAHLQPRRCRSLDDPRQTSLPVSQPLL